MDRDNAMALLYSNLTSDGQGLYLLSPTEFQRFSSNKNIPVSFYNILQCYK